MRFSRIILICFLGLEACGGGGGGVSSPVISAIQITNSPLVVQKGNSIQITATAKDGSGNSIAHPDLTWSVSGGIGTITSGGFFTPPATLPSQDPVTIRVASTSNPEVFATAPLLILTGSTITFPPSPVDITATIQPVGTAPSFQMTVLNQNIYLVWATSFLAGGTHLWYAKLDLNGNFITPPHDILGDITYLTGGVTTSFTFENPVIALDNNVDVNGDPDIFVAWDDNSQGGVFQVGIVKGPNALGCGSGPPCFTPFALTGATSTTSLYVEPLTPVSQQNPSISFNPLGKIVFAWTQAYSYGQYIQYKELALDGSAPNLSVPISASILSNFQKNPQIDADKSGNISVSWIDFGTGSFLPNYSRLAAGSFGSPIQVDSTPLITHDTLSMTLDNSGDPFFAWSNSTANTTKSGINYSATTDFVNFSNNPPLSLIGLNPLIKIDLLKYLYLTWEDSPNIYFEKFNIASSPVPYFLAGSNPSMAIDSAGRVYLLFSRSNGPSISTFFLRGE
jgi:hypothetical protein